MGIRRLSPPRLSERATRRHERGDLAISALVRASAGCGRRSATAKALSTLVAVASRDIV
jgi:hypothetical protein